MNSTSKINWQNFILFAFLFRLFIMDISWYSYFAFMLSAYQFIMLFNAVNHYIPIRYLSGFMMCLQMLIGPALAYNGLDQYQDGYNKMQVPEAVYFTYVLPAVALFILGLNILSKGLPGERPNLEKIKIYVGQHPTLPYFFIVLGFLSSFIANYFSSDLAFVFTVLSTFKFVGLFLVVLGNKGIKPLPLVVVIGSIITSSIAQGMFFDLLTWLTFLASIYALKYKPQTFLKISFVIVFAILAVVIQQLKGDYREATWKQGEAANLETVKKSIKKKEQQSGVFSKESLGNSNLRINQGYIITNIMTTVPDKVAFQEGTELLQILEAALLPRILAPNKLNAGDRFIFMKYSGIPVAAGTSMALSSVGDAYINYGVIGGCVLMFCYGLLFNIFLKLFNRKSKEFPVAILFATVVFYYPIRPDCELQTILGHLLKSTFIIFVIMNIWRYNFKIFSVKKLEYA